jgi:hypothetical protein
MIDIKGKNKAAVLAALYNASRPLGMGVMHFDPALMTVEEAVEIILEIPPVALSFDYLKGRVMKVNLSGDEFDPWLYDRDNGEGAAARALEGLCTF